jgi:hypothetical protein
MLPSNSLPRSERHSTAFMIMIWWMKVQP